jgi:hypothetical protein
MTINNIIISLIITSIIFLLLYRSFSDQLFFAEKITLFSIVSFIIILLFINARDIVKIIKSKNIYNFLAISFAFIGSVIWFVGEYLVYIGREKHSLLDPIGAFFSSFSALITLIIFIHH